MSLIMETVQLTSGETFMLKFYERAESKHRIHNPMTDFEMMQVADYCALTPNTRVLDLGCGSGEMLCRWSQVHGISGVGVDISTVFLDMAHKRAAELRVAGRLEFVQADGATYPQPAHTFDIVSCLGATWIGNGAVGTLDLMRPALADPENGLMLVGEPTWRPNTPDELFAGADPLLAGVLTLPQLVDAFEAGGYQLVAMVDSTDVGWDANEVLRWQTGWDWIQQHPDADDLDAFKTWMREVQREYLLLERPYLDWAVFVLRPLRLW